VLENYYNGKQVVITGGLGFLGSNILAELIRLGAKVTVVDNLNPLYGGNLYNVHHLMNKFTLIINDVRNIEILAPVVKQCDIVFHLAGQVSYIDSLSMPCEDLDLNAKATLNLLEICRKLDRKPKIIFSSSRMVYGKAEQPMLTEKSQTNPLSLYGIHKLTSEKYLLMYYKDFDIPCIIARLTNPYGPNQQIKHNKYSLVGWFIRQALEGKEIRIFGNGRQLRDYIYITDIISALIRLAASPDAIGEIVNVGFGQSTRFCDMVAAVIDCVNNGSMVFVPWPNDYENIETGDVALDLTKLRELTKWNPEIGLKRGIASTYEYYKSNFSNYVSDASTFCPNKTR
jgi:nucleoside-diphosphate-sugar epimerase